MNKPFTGTSYTVRKYKAFDENNKPIRIDGQTWWQWATELFEFEYCAECGKGIRSHEPRIFVGHWFAKCKYLSDDAPLSS